VSNFEVPSPILSSPFEEPKEHWWILEGQPAERRQGRRPALYFYRDPKRETEERGGLAIEMKLVNRIRERVKAWREGGYAGVTRTTLELLQHWRREGRDRRLFFAQIEAVETILFLVEARPDFHQGVEIPRDEPSDDRKADGFAGFRRYACKMATGSGKTTVMGMLAAWSILNKVNDRSDGRFSDVVLIVCPNVTIRDRLRELNPELDEASLYRTRDWKNVPALIIKPDQIPPEVEVKGLNLNNRGRQSLLGPGRVDQITLNERRSHLRVQELVFDVARTLTRDFIQQHGSEVPAQALFPQLVAIVDRYVRKEVVVSPPADLRDLHFAPYYGWLVEVLVESIRPDAANGESPEVPRLEASRGPGSTSEVDFWTTREAREVNKSHINYIVADTRRWEQTAAYYIDTHKAVRAFVKNAGFGFAIPYLYNGQIHDYQPDFIIQFDTDSERFLILETKGYDPLADVKQAAAHRWCAAVNAHGGFGCWSYQLVSRTDQIRSVLDASFETQTADPLRVELTKRQI
jgi:hypothetical protein